MSDEERARVDIIDVCRRLYDKGWVANHDGNVSVRVGDDRIVTTPTAVSKGDIRPEMLIVVDMKGQKLEGTRRPFSELSLHLKAYQARPDIKAVVHAHPVTVSGFAVAGVDLDPTFMPEAVVSLGDRIPTTPFALPFGDEGAAPLEGLIDDFDAFLMANHGALTLGPDVWTAFFRLELMEHLARIQLVARQLGQVRRLTQTQLESLLERRTKAGLGPAARGPTPRGSGWGSSGGGGSDFGSSQPYTPSVPLDGPALSAWGETRPYPSSLCSGERPEPATPERLAETARSIPSDEELRALLAREVSRVLGK